MVEETVRYFLFSIASVLGRVEIVSTIGDIATVVPSGSAFNHSSANACFQWFPYL